MFPATDATETSPKAPLYFFFRKSSPAPVLGDTLYVELGSDVILENSKTRSKLSVSTASKAHLKSFQELEEHEG